VFIRKTQTLLERIAMLKRGTRIFLKGMGRVLDLSSSNSSATWAKIKSRNATSVYEKLYSDWVAVGKDLEKATELYYSGLSQEKQRLLDVSVGSALHFDKADSEQKDRTRQLKHQLKSLLGQCQKPDFEGHGVIIHASTENRQHQLKLAISGAIRQQIKKPDSNLRYSRTTKQGTRSTQRTAALDELRRGWNEIKSARGNIKSRKLATERPPTRESSRE
jgi:hypothetical protein